MAERRMFHAGVVESDAFLDMTPAAQALYFHMGMQADDDGFVNGPRQVCRRCGARMEELQELLDNGFVLWFDGIAVVKHFRMANTLQNDRIKQLNYPEIAKQIYLLPNRIYTTHPGKKKENLFFLREKSLRETRRKSKKILESSGNPKGRKPNPTQPNQTQPNPTQPNPIIIGSREEISNSVILSEQSESKDLRFDGGDSSPMAQNDTPAATYEDVETGDTILLREERDGVVHLTPEQAYKLLTTIGYQRGRYYVQKLAKFIKENDANIKDHYATLMKWWQEDGGIYYG